MLVVPRGTLALALPDIDELPVVLEQSNLS